MIQSNGIRTLHVQKEQLNWRPAIPPDGRSMRVAMLVHSLRRGGGERVTLELALELSRRGHQVCVVSWLDVDDYREERYAALDRRYLLCKELLPRASLNSDEHTTPSPDNQRI